MKENIPVFLAVSVHFLPTAAGEWLAGFGGREDITDLPFTARSDAEAIVQKAVARGAQAIIGETGSRSPFAERLKMYAAKYGLLLAFVTPTAPGNVDGFTKDFRNAQRDLQTAFTNAGREEE